MSLSRLNHRSPRNIHTYTSPTPTPTPIPLPIHIYTILTSNDSAIKPDGVQRGLIGPIISRFESKGFKMAAIKLSRFPIPYSHARTILTRQCSHSRPGAPREALRRPQRQAFLQRFDLLYVNPHPRKLHFTSCSH
jgi:hypothetical protein